MLVWVGIRRPARRWSRLRIAYLVAALKAPRIRHTANRLADQAREAG